MSESYRPEEDREFTRRDREMGEAWEREEWEEWRRWRLEDESHAEPSTAEIFRRWLRGLGRAA